MLIFFNVLLINTLPINFSLFDSQFDILAKKNYEKSEFAINTNQSIATIYKQANFQNKTNDEQKDLQDKLSTLQTLLIIIPLLIIPTAIISFVFYKKIRNRNQLKKDKMHKKN